MKLFIDTWGWLVLRDKKDTKHKEVSNLYNNLRKSGYQVYTTDFVLDETFTLLFRRLSFHQAKESLELLNRAIKEGFLKLEYITQNRLEATKRLRFALKDKPSISFTDLSSMIVMKELKIVEILTEDDHFLKVNLGFRRLP